MKTNLGGLCLVHVSSHCNESHNVTFIDLSILIDQTLYTGREGWKGTEEGRMDGKRKEGGREGGREGWKGTEEGGMDKETDGNRKGRREGGMERDRWKQDGKERGMERDSVRAVSV